jgi:hypothetical protein
MTSDFLDKMLPKKIIIPSLFIVLMLTLFLIFGKNPSRKAVVLEARRTNVVAP